MVTLDFACRCCGLPVKVTLKCAGKAAALAKPVVATLDIPCPTCGRPNRVSFEPTGRVRGVARVCERRRVPQPSMN